MLPVRGGDIITMRQFNVRRAALLAALAIAAGSTVTARAADVEITSSSSTTINLDSYSGATAHVAPGVTVNPAASPAISATAQPWSLANDGSLSGSNTVRLTKGGAVTNSAGATIASTTNAIILGTSGSGGLGAVTNAGTITGGTTGDTVALFGGGTVVNLATGTISAANSSNAVSISGGTSRTVTNDGLISNTGPSFSSGILIQGAGATNTVNNSASGRIVGGYNGIFASATAALNVNNAGSITSTRASAIEATLGGTFVNSGTIASSNLSGILTRNTAAADVTNSGTISGAVNAIDFTATGGGSTGATHTVRLVTGSVLNGNVRGGTGTDNLILGGSGTGTESLAKFSSFETLSAQDGNWTASGAGTFATSATVEGGTLRISGQLTSPTVTVNGGTLAVDGTVAATNGVTVNSGGTLGGAGTVATTTINPGGTLAPGNSIGTITIAGNLTFVGAGNYLVEVSPTSADRTNVTGTAALSGTLRAVGSGGLFTVGTRYTVLNAVGGLSGTFGSLAIAGDFGATRPHIEYDASNVYLVLDPNAISPFLVGATPNQRAVAGAIDTALAAGNQAAPFLALFGLTAAQLPAALDALSGEVHASTAGVLADDSRHVRAAILGRLRQAGHAADGGNESLAALATGGPQALKAPQPRRDVVFWAQGFGAWARYNNDGNAAAVRRDLAGVVTGVDTAAGEGGRAGLAAGYASSRATLDARGAATIESGHVAAYAGWTLGAFNLRGGAALSFHTIDTDRTIAFAGFFDRATAHYDGRTGQAFGELGYGLALGMLALEPFAGAAFVSVQTDATAERGGTAALNLAGARLETATTTLGLRAASMARLGDITLTPRATLAWQHALDDVTPNAVLAFQAATAVPFTIAGVPLARDALLAEAGLDLALSAHATIGVSYAGQLAATTQDHAAKGRFSWRW
jgi:outer membrane autotransporter protein